MKSKGKWIEEWSEDGEQNLIEVQKVDEEMEVKEIYWRSSTRVANKISELGNTALGL